MSDNRLIGSLHPQDMHPLCRPRPTTKVFYKLTTILSNEAFGFPVFPDELFDGAEFRLKSRQIRKLLKCIVEGNLGNGPKICVRYFYVNDKLDFLRSETRGRPV